MMQQEIEILLLFTMYCDTIRITYDAARNRTWSTGMTDSY